ncbi:metallophosphoesterase family protein [Amycolatopsis sp. cmx-11-32]|uniref:metallophosphoesterase family protein n=1 Tax=Amycolatopsis sp. cmx-11-32 TaxID=2785796 RepID=UPI0039E25733
MDRRSFMLATGGAVAATTALGVPAEATPGRDPFGMAVRFNIISDIQGDLADFGKALDDINAINPRSAGLGVAGDITPRGYDFEYAQVRSTLDKHPHPRKVAWAIGNHEFYVPKWRDPDTLAQETWPNGTTEDSLFRSFYNFAGRNTVYSETSFDGVPVLCLGTERYAKYHDPKLWDEVWISDRQFTWLEQRLAYWDRWRKPVMVLTHHPTAEHRVRHPQQALPQRLPPGRPAARGARQIPGRVPVLRAHPLGPHPVGLGDPPGRSGQRQPRRLHRGQHRRRADRLGGRRQGR